MGHITNAIVSGEHVQYEAKEGVTNHVSPRAVRRTP